MSNSDISSTNSLQMGQEDEDASRLGDNEDNRSTNDSTQRLIESLARHKSKSDSRISKNHSRKSSSRKSSRHRKNRESGKSASRKPGFSTPTFYRNNPATNSRKSLPRFPSPDISENTRNSESDISHGF